MNCMNPGIVRTVSRAVLKPAENHSGDLAYWLAQPLEARILAVETLRLQQHPELADAHDRIQRICRIAPLKRS